MIHAALPQAIPQAGIEPARPEGQQILSLQRLPIPPLGHVLVGSCARRLLARF